MRLVREERGQSISFMVVFLVVLVGIVALVIDVGSWYRAQRQLQTAADSAVLAGAYSLPTTATAQSDATNFLNTSVALNNEPTTAITFPAPNNPGGMCDTGVAGQSNCIAVNVSHQASGLFAPVLNSVLKSITVSAHAQAALVSPGAVKNVAPIGVNKTDACQPPPAGTCTFPHPAVLDFDDPSNQYQLLDLDTHDPNTPQPQSHVGTNQMKTWITAGDQNALPAPSWYANTNGSKNGLQVAFQADATSGKVLLIPVFDTGDLATGSLHVIGWAAFVIDANGVNWNNGGAGHSLTGKFVRYVANGLPAGGSGQSFGVLSISLVG